MKAQRVKVFVALLVIAGSAGYFYWKLNPMPDTPDLRIHSALGQRVASEAARLAGGGKVILIAPDTTTFPNACADAQLKAFRTGLKSANVAVTATNLIKLDPLRPVRVEPGTFLAALRKTTEKDLVVSFMGPPIIPADQRRQAPPQPARVLAVCSGDLARQIPLSPIFASGLLEAAVIAPLNGPGGDSIQVVTKANVADFR
jgi:hypothetical protein